MGLRWGEVLMTLAVDGYDARTRRRRLGAQQRQRLRNCGLPAHLAKKVAALAELELERHKKGSASGEGFSRAERRSAAQRPST